MYVCLYTVVVLYRTVCSWYLACHNTLLLQCLELVPALITPTHVALHGITVKQLMATATVVQTATPWATVAWIFTALHVKIIIIIVPCIAMWLHLNSYVQSQEPALMWESPHVAMTQWMAAVMCIIDHFTITGTTVHAMHHAMIEMIAVLTQWQLAVFVSSLRLGFLFFFYKYLVIALGRILLYHRKLHDPVSIISC